jgi:hypothetical protein
LQWLQDLREINGDNPNKKDMKPAGISGINRKYLKDKINALATKSTNKSITDLLSGVTNLELSYWMMRMVIGLQIPTTF